jgi:hypothetical protein
MTRDYASEFRAAWRRAQEAEARGEGRVVAEDMAGSIYGHLIPNRDRQSQPLKLKETK